LPLAARSIGFYSQDAWPRRGFADQRRDLAKSPRSRNLKLFNRSRYFTTILVRRGHSCRRPVPSSVPPLVVVWSEGQVMYQIDIEVALSVNEYGSAAAAHHDHVPAGGCASKRNVRNPHQNRSCACAVAEEKAVMARARTRGFMTVRLSTSGLDR
jgi:hypothetical protein